MGFIVALEVIWKVALEALGVVLEMVYKLLVLRK